MNKENRWIFLVVILGLLLALLISESAGAKESMNICHKTSSQSHPWEAIQIDDDAWETHQAHGDKPYDGPTKNGKPTKEGNEWCADGTTPQKPQENTVPQENTIPTVTDTELPRVGSQ